MSSPQNISEGTCVMLNGYGCGLDFNDEYIIVQKMPPCSEDSCEESDCDGCDCCEEPEIYDIQLLCLTTLEVVRTLKGCTQFITEFQLLGNLVIAGSRDEMIR
jgi:hypothetical protein